MPDTILYNVLFAVIITVFVVAMILFFNSRKRKGKNPPDDNLTVSGMFQTGLTHRFNTPMHRK